MAAERASRGSRRSAAKRSAGRAERSSPLARLRERARSGRATDAEDLFYEDLADRVIEQRVARDLSQEELAQLCGTTQSAIARLERGGRPPRIDTLLRLANALDCELVIELEPRTTTRRKSA